MRQGKETNKWWHSVAHLTVINKTAQRSHQWIHKLDPNMTPNIAHRVVSFSTSLFIWDGKNCGIGRGACDPSSWQLRAKAVVLCIWITLLYQLSKFFYWGDQSSATAGYCVAFLVVVVACCCSCCCCYGCCLQTWRDMEIHVSST